MRLSPALSLAFLGWGSAFLSLWLLLLLSSPRFFVLVLLLLRSSSFFFFFAPPPSPGLTSIFFPPPAMVVVPFPPAVRWVTWRPLPVSLSLLLCPLFLVFFYLPFFLRLVVSSAFNFLSVPLSFSSSLRPLLFTGRVFRYLPALPLATFFCRALLSELPFLVVPLYSPSFLTPPLPVFTSFFSSLLARLVRWVARFVWWVVGAGLGERTG